MKSRSQDAPTVGDFLQLYKKDTFVWESPAFSAYDSRTWLTTPSSAGVDDDHPHTTTSDDAQTPKTELSEVSEYFDRGLLSFRTSTPLSSCTSTFSEYFDACSYQDFVGEILTFESENVDIKLIDDDPDGKQYSSILEWLTLLFTDVVNAELRPTASNTWQDPDAKTPVEGSSEHTPSSYFFQDDCPGGLELETQSISPLTFEDDTKPLVNLGTYNTSFSPARMETHAITIGYHDGDRGVDWACTSKSISMWGRRLERIPKVRVPGQKEAIYCFDESKRSRLTERRPRPDYHSWTPPNIDASVGDNDRLCYARDPYDYRQNSRPKLGSRSSTYSGGVVEQGVAQIRGAHSFGQNWSMMKTSVSVPSNYFGGGPMGLTLRGPQSPWIYAMPHIVR